MGEEPGQTGAPVPPDDERLDSWKEIAAHFNRSVRTVQSWEKREGLPVHRHVHGRGGSVYAYTSELEAWWRNGRERVRAQESLEKRGSGGMLGGAVRPLGRLLLAGALLVGLGVGLAFWLPRDGSPDRGTAIDSLAVLPIANESGDDELDYLSDGLTDVLINTFARLQAVRVVPRSTVIRYAGRAPVPSEVGRELGVRAVLTGRVTRHGEVLVVAVELVDVERRSQIWGQRYDHERGDLHSIQGEIAREIARRLLLEVAPDERQLLTPRTTSAEAYDLYLKGLHHFNRVDYLGLADAAGYFRRAAEADPDYALPHLGLANVYSTIGYHGMALPHDIWPQVEAAARRALELDETLAGAHAALGHAVLFYEWDWPRAERSLARALALDPGYAPTHHWYAHYWLTTGNMEEALEASRRAVELEPLDMLLRGHEFYLLAGAGRAAELAERCPQAAEVDARHWLIATCQGHALRLRGRLSEAIAELEQAAARSDGASLALTDLGVAFAEAGRRADAERVIGDLLERAERQGYTVSVKVAQIRAALGQIDEAFELLERGYAERAPSLLWLRTKGFWGVDRLSGDPRYDELLRRVGLP